MSSMMKAMMQGAAGTAASASSELCVEDVFSTYLYDGQSNTATKINNGINLSEEGGMVWVKCRSNSVSHHLYDTERGVAARLESDSNNAEASTPQLGSFDSDGFTHSATPTNQNLDINETGRTFASWTFRKAPKFFDVVTWTGDGTNPRNISHNLGSVPGCIIVKETSGGNYWRVYHRSVGNDKVLYLSESEAESVETTWNNTTPTDTVFTVRNSPLNTSGTTFVAYLFAHNDGDGEFGESGDQDIIKCGSAAATGLTTVNCGFEPQWVLIKSATVPNSWYIFDSIRGLHVTGIGPQTLNPNLPNAEYTEDTDACNLTSTGFTFNSSEFNGNATYIYIAIRRGPMRTPTSGSEVFGLNKYTETTDYQQLTTGNVVDLGWQLLNGDGYKFFTRLLGAGHLSSSSTAALNTSAATKFDYMDGFAPYAANAVTNINPREVYGFKRAHGFFDVVTYKGDAATSRDVSHNLGVVPEFIIVKSRNGASLWCVYHKDYSPTYHALALNESGSRQNYSGFPGTMTSTTFSIGHSSTNSGNSFYWYYVAYLFASVPRVSKVGSYTGNGTSQNINCGFKGGARFVLIKRTDSSGDWHVWDTARGIVTGTEPFLELNTTNAENTSYDSVDPYVAGFSVNQDSGTNINVSNGAYIFLAIS